MTVRAKVKGAVTVALAADVLVGAGPVQTDDFYAGTTIALIAGFPPGGGVELQKLVAQHLSSVSDDVLREYLAFIEDRHGN